MSSDVDRWHSVESALKQLGVVHIERIRRTRDRFVQASSTGAYLLPDFTLHNVTHSDNIILLLTTLQRAFDFTLCVREAELLATSAYLHDLGMFFSRARWEEKIIPDFANKLKFCPIDSCDSPKRYNLRGKDVGSQIRLSHNLLSAYWLLNSSPDAFDFDADDRGYLITLCRGHRATDLKAKACTCYRTKAVEGQALRVGILTSLLRLSDALDFYNNRTPKPVFEQRALDFLSNPIALEHWIKHYFVSDPYVRRDSRGYGQMLACTLYFTVPMKYINGVPYSDFFRPLFEKHVNELASSALDADKYPADFISLLGISGMDAELVEDVIPGFRELPPEIASIIEESGCQDILAFLKWLPNRASAIAVVQEKIQFLEEITHQLVAPLNGVQASCEWLLSRYDGWDRERILHEIENIQFQARWAARLARNYAFVTAPPVKVTLSLRLVDLSSLLISCARDFQGIARERRVRVHVDLTSIVPQAQLNTALFKQAVANVLDNALKYAVNDTQVTIQAVPSPSNIRIEVINYGIPIREEEVEKIFERGYRARQATSKFRSGTGIGLSVAREIIRMHGGDLIAFPSAYEETVGAFKTTIAIVLPCPPCQAEEGE